MFDDEMTVQKNGFDASEQGIVGVQIGPARLHHADFFAAVGIHEIRNGAAKEIGPRDEVGVKDGNEFALGAVKTIFERAGFVTFAIGAMDVNNGETARSVAFDAGTGDVARFVGGINRRAMPGPCSPISVRTFPRPPMCQPAAASSSANSFAVGSTCPAAVVRPAEKPAPTNRIASPSRAR